MKHSLLLSAVILAFPSFAADRSPAAQAALTDIQKTLGFVPAFLKAYPDSALPGTWEEMKGLQMSPNTAIPVKYKELIGLAVSSQIPCSYCIIAHTEFAKANGATADEISNAVAEASLARHWSTWFNGIQLDEARFRTELTKMLEQMKKMDPNAAPPMPIEVVDQASALRDIEQTMGAVPEFFKKFPAAALPGAWKAMRGVEMNPRGPVPPKYLSLMSLAVAAQVPCRYCVIADTEFAKFNGATEAEIYEAVAMSAFTRQMSTLLNGLQVDEATFKADVTRLTRPQPKGKSVAGK